MIGWSLGRSCAVRPDEQLSNIQRTPPPPPPPPPTPPPKKRLFYIGAGPLEQ